ncbi:hypothetical protein ASPZODRAFT_69972 [Penicilliopsis zonata CBS 506.65]|uniref:Major facilitator superfamily (MFS) profile domain-containing protein n=1 Tax=Penicilliopsis zonata CBS 506.65 TaxID=1073090 RepID=A0A1L9SDZ7_9EURO|nr:hypothetical protein ASPZODRAFT_69972 [Penicilliopsis zonata CBS 506.65]OJJ45401.1 hypothetical protein ASPZODRAFT_69972 [Penicilliopsis zonata CBS 506.65]
MESEIENAPARDVEKQIPSQIENSAAAAVAAPSAEHALSPAVDPAVEARLLRKLDKRIPTLLAFLYLLAYLDRSNIGNAEIAGMEEDLNLVGNRYSWLLTIFYISYCVFEFQALMWKVLKPHRWASIVVFAWGVIASCQAATKSWQGMMALRFLMGIFEAGFGPGVPYLLSFFYRRRELGLRCGLFLSAAPLASTFAGALAYGITSGHPRLASWRVLFLVEGLPSCVAAILPWFFLPDDPTSARFLTEEEKEVARTRSLQQTGEVERAKGIVWKDIGLTLMDAKAWFTALMYFSCNVSFSSLPVFLPTIIADMGFTDIHAQGLTAPPYFISFLVTIASTYVADRLEQRGYAVAFLSLIGAIGYVLLATCENVGARYFGVFLAASGVFPAIANILPWVLNNQGSDTRRGMGIILLNLVGQCGPFLGTQIFPSSGKPRYIEGQSICAAFMFFTTLLALGLRFLLKWENGRLDKKYAAPDAQSSAQDEKTIHLGGEDNYGANFSNGIRFSISDLAPPTARIMPVVFQDRAGISLYDAQFSHSDGMRGPIPDQIIDQVVARLVHFKITCDDFCVSEENIHVLATEATRTAPNSAEFRTRIKDATGWEVRMLSKEEEGRIGALGVASSSTSIAGLAMDLGGGSTQITWVIETDGVVKISPKGSFSFPYGAAALGRRLEQAREQGEVAEKQLKEEMMSNFREAYRSLEVPDSLLNAADANGGFDLYLCGGGFRGWGYLLMSQARVRPYPIPIINGYRASRESFHDTESLQDIASNPDAKVFGVSKRRASQIPAVAFLVNVMMEALPAVKSIQFCQGGVREGFLFDRLPAEVRLQDPLLAATAPYASPSRDAIRDLLLSALPERPSSLLSRHPPASFSYNLVTALADLLYAHANVPRESRSAAALHSTTTGVLSCVNSLSHVDRAILALILPERWGADFAPTEQLFQDRLLQLVSVEEAWWCLYLGRIAALVGDVYPSGRVPPESQWRVRLQTSWDTIAKKKERRDVLRVQVILKESVSTTVLKDSLQDTAERIEKVGKKKNWIKPTDSESEDGYGVRVAVDIAVAP